MRRIGIKARFLPEEKVPGTVFFPVYLFFPEIGAIMSYNMSKAKPTTPNTSQLAARSSKKIVRHIVILSSIY